LLNLAIKQVCKGLQCKTLFF